MATTMILSPGYLKMRGETCVTLPICLVEEGVEEAYSRASCHSSMIGGASVRMFGVNSQCAFGTWLLEYSLKTQTEEEDPYLALFFGF